MATALEDIGSTPHADTVSPPSAMSKIPLELAAIIIECLVEYDLEPHPRSEWTEEPTVKSRYELNCARWIRPTETSRTEILNARLTSRMLYSASSKAFAILLADRPFGFTKEDTDDLHNISQHDRLNPYVTTLTISCAGFSLCSKFPVLWKMTNHLESSDQNRITTAYKTCFQWQWQHLPKSREMITSLLSVFPNLSSIRIQSDGNSPYPRGWLKATDVKLLSDENDHNAKHLSLSTFRSHLHDPFVMSVHGVIQAAIDARVPLKDLRLNCGGTLPGNLSVSTIHTFRPFVIGPFYSKDEVREKLLLIVFLLRATNLKDLELTTDDHANSAEFMKALVHQTELRRLCFTGCWRFEHGDIVELVKRNARTLRCIIFRGVTLIGSWRSLLATIAGATQDQLEFFQARSVWEIRPKNAGYVIGGSECVIFEADLSCFKCPARWKVRENSYRTSVEWMGRGAEISRT